MPWDLPQGQPGCWKGLLLTATILSSSIQQTLLTQLSITSIPSQGMIGSNITLSVRGIPKESKGYSWFRQMMKESNKIVSYAVESRKQTRGLNHTGRESIFPNGSLFLTNVTFNDSGFYIVQVTMADLKAVLGQGHLQINDSSKISSFGLVASIVLGALAGGVIMGVLGYFLFKRTQRSSQNIRRYSAQRRRTNLVDQNHGREDTVYENHQWHGGMMLTAQGEDLSSIYSPGILEGTHQALDISKMDAYDEVKIWPTVKAPRGGGRPPR